MTDAEHLCGNMKSNCDCHLPVGHESPHLCRCGGSWTRDDNLSANDGDVIRLPSGDRQALDDLTPTWDGNRWAFYNDAGDEVEVKSLGMADAILGMFGTWDDD